VGFLAGESTTTTITLGYLDIGLQENVDVTIPAFSRFLNRFLKSWLFC